MTLRLTELETCFEGVVPAIIATLSADGVPNISYLSHIVRVDDRHIALSNQFFGKTASNLRAVPKATILLVDGRSGTQVRAEAFYIRSETTGQTFDRVAAQLAATSAQVGMAEVMVLRSVDVFLVTALGRVASDSQMTAPVRHADQYDFLLDAHRAGGLAARKAIRIIKQREQGVVDGVRIFARREVQLDD